MGSSVDTVVSVPLFGPTRSPTCAVAMAAIPSIGDRMVVKPRLRVAVATTALAASTAALAATIAALATSIAALAAATCAFAARLFWTALSRSWVVMACGLRQWDIAVHIELGLALVRLGLRELALACMSWALACTSCPAPWPVRPSPDRAPPGKGADQSQTTPGPA